MHFPALIKKINFVLTDKLFLSDTVRNFAYQWAWLYLAVLSKGSSLCDIGSRDSIFPAFLAWRKLNVSAIERDERFVETQKRIALQWNVQYDVFASDFSSYTPLTPVDAVCSIFSLQHAGQSDVDCYAKAAVMLKPQGLFLSACEYDDCATRWDENRDDGALRIYGPQDVVDRIETPIISRGMEIISKRYAKTIGKNHGVKALSSSRGATLLFLCAKKIAFFK